MFLLFIAHQEMLTVALTGLLLQIFLPSLYIMITHSLACLYYYIYIIHRFKWSDVCLRKGHDAGDHPPITPMKSATEGDLDHESWKLYDYITRHFIATVSLQKIFFGLSLHLHPVLCENSPSIFTTIHFHMTHSVISIRFHVLADHCKWSK